jgi:predicted RNA-binding Zn-ribbon protein involved in translation (DUF1610 family)
MSERAHVPLPKDTPAFFCGNCGAVALDPKNICRPVGKGKKADWCGSRGVQPPSYCQNRVNVNRWQCRNCGKVSVNPELLCEPGKLDIPE